MTSPAEFDATTNAFALADVFRACLNEEELFRLSLTCSAFKKVLTPQHGFPIAFAIKNDFEKFNDALWYSRVIPSEETFKYMLITFDALEESLLAFKYVRSAFVNSTTFWNQRNSTHRLKLFIDLKLVKLGKIYFCPYEPSSGNYELRKIENYCCSKETHYYMGYTFTKEEQEELLKKEKRKEEEVEHQRTRKREEVNRVYKEFEEARKEKEEKQINENVFWKKLEEKEKEAKNLKKEEDREKRDAYTCNMSWK